MGDGFTVAPTRISKRIRMDFASRATSRLIESLLLEIPIPPIYFGQDMSGRLEMIDGQERLTTLIKFVSNDFPLRKLNRMASLNHKYFKERDRTPSLRRVRRSHR